MPRLLLLLLLIGCDVSRDLRAEKFACDAGGLCGSLDSGSSDSGVAQVVCSNSCNCNTGRDCSYRCSTSPCTITCAENTNCEVACGLDVCTTICQSGADCHINCMIGVRCDTTCEQGSSCTIECPVFGGNCTCSGPECPF
jgi:hypothetical protein